MHITTQEDRAITLTHGAVQCNICRVHRKLHLLSLSVVGSKISRNHELGESELNRAGGRGSEKLRTTTRIYLLPCHPYLSRH